MDKQTITVHYSVNSTGTVHKPENMSCNVTMEYLKLKIMKYEITLNKRDHKYMLYSNYE